MTNPILTADIPAAQIVTVRGCALRWNLYGRVCSAYQFEKAKPHDFRDWTDYDIALDDYRAHIAACDQCQQRDAAILAGSTVVPHPEEPTVSAERAELIERMKRERGL